MPARRQPVRPDGLGPKIRVTKLEAAQRELEAAIRMYARDEDPVAIHVLVGAAYDIVCDLFEERVRRTGKQPSPWEVPFKLLTGVLAEHGRCSKSKVPASG